MQKFKFLPILIMACMFSFVATSNNELPGFIISSSGDTIPGRVLNINQKSIFSTCSFKTDEVLQVYEPGEIIGFGNNSQFFTSQVIDSSFVEVLVEGTISLYKRDEIFLVTKNGELFTLQSEEKKVTKGKSEYLLKNNKWRGVLSFLINDCLINSSKLTSNIDFDEKRLTQLVQKYNQCKGGTMKEYKSEVPWSALRFGVYGGYNFTHIRIKETGSVLPESLIAKDPGVGFVLELCFPRKSKNFSYVFEPYYLKSNFSQSFFEEKNDIQTCYTSTATLETLTFPLSVKIVKPLRYFDLHFQIGALIDYQLQSETNQITRSSDGYEIIRHEDQKIFSVNKTQMGLVGGLGVSKNMNKVNVGIGIRYLSNLFLSNYKIISVYNDKISINLTIMKI